MQTITDLGFAGDLALPSDTVEQETGNSLGFIHKRQKLAFISTLRKKTQYMSLHFNQTSNEPLRTGKGSKLQQVQDCKYLCA